MHTPIGDDCYDVKFDDAELLRASNKRADLTLREF